ncbi:Translation initiation factor 2 [Planctomycetales bacterium 10988]|nr:Translation initiation factor 2 [Planctomycetales bacterium 10988]
MNKIQQTIFSAWMLGGLLALGTTQSLQAAALVQVEVFPPEVNLETLRDRQSLIVQATYADGVTKDVTEQAKFVPENPALVKLQDSTLYPAQDGKTTIRVQFEGNTVEVPVSVKKAKQDRPISFRLDVMPVFTKSGCNMGSCHGAARGKDGFRLSLFGFDPEGDHFRLTREINGRRINLALPEESLLMEKAIGSVPHTGGKLFGKESELYTEIVRWLSMGAPNDSGEVAELVGLELYPLEAVMQGRGTTQDLTVRATYSDGTNRDVTHLSYFMTNNENSVAVDQAGIMQAGERGEAFVTARFMTMTIGIPIIVLPENAELEFPNLPQNNYIDELVDQKLKKLRIAPSELADDETFLRRVSIDLVGQLPTVEEYRAFIDNPAPNKRRQLIDELIERPEFVDIWVMKWSELLTVRSVRNRVSYKAMLLYNNWLKDQISNNVPVSEMVIELLSAEGSIFDNPPVNFYHVERDRLKIAENVAQVFMGMRLQCAQCHNHPFDRWTMDDYYSFAAFFSQIGRKNGEDPRETIYYNRRSGGQRHPVTNEVMKPRYLGGDLAEFENGEDYRANLAHWLASPENPYFAKNISNIAWAHFFGRGIIDEVDDVRVTNPPSNGPLLETLGEKFAESNYDFKQLVRDICNSRTYQLSTQANATNSTDETNFSKAKIRRIRAEVLLDCLDQVTKSPSKFRGLPLGARAVEIADGSTSTYFLQTFGRASRETVCSCEVKMEPNLSQALHLLNGSTVSSNIVRGKVVSDALKEKQDPKQILETIYLRALCRKPSVDEVAAFNQMLAEKGANHQQILEDIFWAVLNSREFIFNH